MRFVYLPQTNSSGGGKQMRIENRLWVVISQRGGEWEICDFTDNRFAHTNYYKAHRHKKAIQEYLQKHCNKSWTQRKFKVVEFKAK